MAIPEARDLLVENRGFINSWIIILDAGKKVSAAAEAGFGESLNPMLEKLQQGEPPTCSLKVLDASGEQVIENRSFDCSD